MADNMQVTAGAGTSVATDEIGGNHHQRVKVSLGANGSAVDAEGGSGAANPGTQRVILASDDPAVALLSILAAVVADGQIQSDIVAVPADPYGSNADAAATNGSISAKLRRIATDLNNVIAGNEMQVDIVAPLPAGDNAIGKLSANAGVNIGTVAVSTVPADPFGATADAASSSGSMSAKLRRIATDLNAVVSGNEMQVDIVASLPAGANAIGKLAANDGVDIGDVTVNGVPTDPFGLIADAASTSGSISAKLRSIATDLDNVVSGNEMQVDVVGALPAGANTIGAVNVNGTVPVSGNVGVSGTVAVSSGNVNVAGTVSVGAVTNDGLDGLADMTAGLYETVAAGQSDQALGATGAAGDYLTSLLVIPATTSPGNVQIKDGSGSAITVFTGGADSVSNLVPFAIPVNLASSDGAWQVTTGSDVSVLATGNFT